MGAKAMKLVTVSPNGQISIGKAWAGRQICVEEVSSNEIRISAGTFIPDAHRSFFTKDAFEKLDGFNEWEVKNPAKATDTKVLFASLKKRKPRGK